MNPPFALFAGENYECRGGIHDLRGTYATLDEAIFAGYCFIRSDLKWRWFHVVDLGTLQEVANNGTINNKFLESKHKSISSDRVR